MKNLGTGCGCSRPVGAHKIHGDRVCDVCYAIHVKNHHSQMQRGAVSRMRASWQRAHARVLDLLPSPDAYSFGNCGQHDTL